jgi:hypothetical protein
MDAEASPLPRELTTPPVTKMYLVFFERISLPAKEVGVRQWFCGGWRLGWCARAQLPSWLLGRAWA